MQKRTALRTATHRKTPGAGHDVGLIAEADARKQSARTKSALDNRSHRTLIRPVRQSVNRSIVAAITASITSYLRSSAARPHA